MARLYSAGQYVKSLTAFKSYFTKLKSSDDLERTKFRLVDSIDTMRFYIKDIECSLHESKQFLKAHDSTLATFKNTIETASDIDTIKGFAPLLDLLSVEQFNDLWGYHTSSFADDVKYGYGDALDYPDTFMKDIRKIINNSKINIFFPNCNKGDNAFHFKNDDDLTYGNTDNNIRLAREKMHRVLHGPLKGSVISNNFFDAVFVNPMIGYEEKKDYMNNLIEPCERLEVKNCIKYLRPGGLMIIALPSTRIMPAFAMYLSKVLTNVNVFKAKEIHDSVSRLKLQRVIITGIKKKENTTVSDENIYKMLKCFDYDTALDISNTEVSYTLPTDELVLELFRGSKLDLADVTAAMNVSIIDNFLINQTQPLVVKDQSPLQPFNIGQVGLVLTSGCLDGVVEEMDGVHHVIKGMTTKVTSTVQEDLEDNKIKSTETISNQVKINVFTADGEFIQLG